MSNELENELQLFDQFEHEQKTQEVSQLREFAYGNTLAAWDAMTKKQEVKVYHAMVDDDGEEVWSKEVVKALYCSCKKELERLCAAKSDEAFREEYQCPFGSLSAVCP